MELTKEEIAKLIFKDGNVIDDSEFIGDIPLENFMNLTFEGDIADELACVHLTDFAPVNDEILSTEKGKRVVTSLFDGEKTISHRLTCHTTLNGPVCANNGGEWNYRLYSILTPYKSIDSKVCGLGIADTFFQDKINLGDDTVILVNEEDKDKVDERIPQEKIVYYRGNRDIVIYKMLLAMGYKPQALNIQNFTNHENDKLLEEYRKENNIGPSLHSCTFYYLIEKQLASRDEFMLKSRYDGEHNDEMAEEIYNLKSISLAELERLVDAKKRDNDKESIIEVLLEYGIDFDNDKEFDGAKLLTTEETLDRISKYYNQEDNRFFDFDSYPELDELYQRYTYLMSVNKTYDEALSENEIYDEYQNLINKNFGELTQEEINKLINNKYFNNEIQRQMDDVENYLSDVGLVLRIKPYGSSLCCVTDEPIFTIENFEELSFIEEELNCYNFNYEPNLSIKDNINLILNRLDEFKLKVSEIRNSTSRQGR